MAQKVKHLPAMRETGVRPLGQEDPLEKEMATYLSTLAWKIPWMEEPGGLQSMGLQSWTRLSDFTFTFSLANISWNSQPQGRDVLNFFLPEDPWNVLPKDLHMTSHPCLTSLPH